jgi:hypothetical protein
MRFDTQDLLTLRDGEPMDAERKARVLADPGRVREIGRLEQLQRALRALPELSPPDAAWTRIAEELARPASRSRRLASRAAAAAVGAAVLAAFAAAVIGSRDGAPSTPEAVTNFRPPTEIAPAGEIDAAAGAPYVHSALAAESARLERVLGQISFQPEVMNVGTAGTIASLEDTLAALDEQLTFAAAGGLDPNERETLWRERVNVMRALVQVRYAQSQRTGL